MSEDDYLRKAGWRQGHHPTGEAYWEHPSMPLVNWSHDAAMGQQANWAKLTPPPIHEMPGAVAKQGLTDEEEAWCRRIVEQYSDRPDVIAVKLVRERGRLRTELEAAKEHLRSQTAALADDLTQARAEIATLTADKAALVEQAAYYRNRLMALEPGCD